MGCNETTTNGPPIRQRIVDAVARTLGTVPTIASRVYVFCPTAFDERNLPAANVRDLRETDEGKCGNCSIKSLEFSTDLLVAEKAGSDAVVRELLQAAQIALLGNPNLDGLADETRLSSNQMAVGQAGFCAVGCRLVFTVRYRVKL
ncbi:MAG: hypothetical protein DMF62_03215 [Acidobacteria bacterium]|nr:MAG: hypothetical protein DMF62_03215 [Acidobacteriota bacterium]